MLIGSATVHCRRYLHCIGDRNGPKLAPGAQVCQPERAGFCWHCSGYSGLCRAQGGRRWSRVARVEIEYVTVRNVGSSRPTGSGFKGRSVSSGALSVPQTNRACARFVSVIANLQRGLVEKRPRDFCKELDPEFNRRWIRRMTIRKVQVRLEMR